MSSIQHSSLINRSASPFYFSHTILSGGALEDGCSSLLGKELDSKIHSIATANVKALARAQEPLWRAQLQQQHHHKQQQQVLNQANQQQREEQYRRQKLQEEHNNKLLQLQQQLHRARQVQQQQGEGRGQGQGQGQGQISGWEHDPAGSAVPAIQHGQQSFPPTPPLAGGLQNAPSTISAAPLPHPPPPPAARFQPPPHHHHHFEIPHCRRRYRHRCHLTQGCLERVLEGVWEGGGALLSSDQARAFIPTHPSIVAMDMGIIHYNTYLYLTISRGNSCISIISNRGSRRRYGALISRSSSSSNNNNVSCINQTTIT